MERRKHLVLVAAVMAAFLLGAVGGLTDGYDSREEQTMKYQSYEVVHYNVRSDGRIEPAGIERVVLTREEAIEMSHTAIVLSMSNGIGGKRTAIVEGKHCQFDAHLGWLS
jgi:hypothetical protein